MELFFLFGVTIFALFVSYSVGFLFSTKNSNTCESKLPPGQLGWPFVGESLQFFKDGWNGHPEKFISERTRKYASNVFTTSILGAPTIVLCGPAGNKFLYSNENKYVQAWWPKSVDKIFASPTNSKAAEQSTRMRKMLPILFKPEALQRHVGIMDNIAQRHLASEWEGKKEITVFPLAKGYTFWLACRLFLSIDDPKHVKKYAEPFNALASGLISLPIDLPGTPFNKGIKASNYIRKELLSIIMQRKIDLENENVSPTQDILSHMLCSCDEDGKYMTELDIANKILGLLIGGHDTASAAITFIIKYLAELPHIYEGVRKEQLEIAKAKQPGEPLNWDDLQKMKYSWNVACEVMRLAPPVQGAFRQALTDFVFDGFKVPKGWKLYWSTHSTHKNPEYFSEPEKFDPSRFEGTGPAPYTYVPFGGGPRMCPGKEYARLEILVFMHNVVKRFTWKKIVPNENIIVDPLPIPAKGLPIRLISCQV